MARKDAAIEIAILLALYWFPAFLNGLEGFTSPIPPGDPRSTIGFGWSFAVYLGRNLAVIGTLFWLLRFRRERLSQPLSLSDVGFAIGLLLIHWCAIKVTLPFARGFFPSWQDKLYAGNMAVRKVAPVFMELTRATVGPAAEELVMRGFLQTRLSQMGLPSWAVVLASATLQASYHVYQGMAFVAVDVILFGIYAVAFQWKRRLWPIWMTHVAWDLYVFAYR